MSKDSYEYSGFKRNYPKVDDGFYLVKNGITYKVDLPMDKTRFTKRINILTGEVYYPSNADRIRAMTDEELAEWFIRIQYDVSDYYCGGHSCEPTLPTGEESWLGWLKQEAANDNDDH